MAAEYICIIYIHIPYTICIIDKCQLYCIIVLHYDVLRKLSTSLCFHSLFISFLNSFFSVSLCHQFAMFSHVSRHFSIHQFADSLLSYFPTRVVDTCQLPIRETEGENKAFADGLQTLHSIASLILIPRSQLHSKSFFSELAIGQVCWQLPKVIQVVGMDFVRAS